MTSLYKDWNLDPDLIPHLTEYSLLRLTLEELELNTYKTLELVDQDNKVDMYQVDFHLLYKGKLFPIQWQNESLLAYIKPETYNSEPRFIVSIREFEGTRVALIQRDRHA